MTSIEGLNYLEKEQNEGKHIFMADYQKWLEDFSTLKDQYLDMNFLPDGIKQADDEFNMNPYLGYNVVFDWYVNYVDPSYNVRKLLDYILRPEVFNIVVRGSPGSGKTTTAYALLDILKDKGFNIVQIAPFVDVEALPKWISWKHDIYDLEMGDFALVDEAALQFSARNFGSKQNKEAFDSMPVGRHIGAKLLLLTQMMSETDIKAVRWANISISKGYPTSAFGEGVIERKDIADDVLGRYLKPKNNYAVPGSFEKDWSVCTVNNFKFMVYLPQPSFMTDMMSRSYRKFIEMANGDWGAAEKLALAAAELMRDNERPAVVIRRELAIRGYKKSLEYWMKYTGELRENKRGDYEMRNGRRGSEVDRLG